MRIAIPAVTLMILGAQVAAGFRAFRIERVLGAGGFGTDVGPARACIFTI